MTPALLQQMLPPPVLQPAQQQLPLHPKQALHVYHTSVASGCASADVTS
jgi:hypothetical protein